MEELHFSHLTIDMLWDGEELVLVALDLVQPLVDELVAGVEIQLPIFVHGICVLHLQGIGNLQAKLWRFTSPLAGSLAKATTVLDQ